MADDKTLAIIRAAYGDPGARLLAVEGEVMDPFSLPGLPNRPPSFPRPTDPAAEPAHVFHAVRRGGRAGGPPGGPAAGSRT